MRKQLRPWVLLLLVSILSPSALGQTAVKISSAERKIAEGITADQLRDYLYFVASDEMGGRDTPSKGLDLTAKFIGTMLSRWGFKPAGDNGTWYQRIELGRETVVGDKTFLKIGNQTFSYPEDLLQPGNMFIGYGSAAGAGLVFGGNGWMVKSKSYDALAGVDVRGKIVVLYDEIFPSESITILPSGITKADLTGTPGTDWADPVTNAKNKGAVGIMRIADPMGQKAWANIVNSVNNVHTFVERVHGGPNLLPVVYVSERVADALFPGEAGNKTSQKAFVINKTADLSVTVTKESLMTQNVVAVWEGADPVLKNEMVAIGAHYDHVGASGQPGSKCPNVPGDDRICNGADDDGSGTVTVLSIAEALAKAPKRPRRSVLLVWHMGEEQGMWGSEYFNKYPTVDIKKVVAQLNIDMIGRSKQPDKAIPCDKPGKPCNDDLTGPNEIYIVGSEMMSSTMAATVVGVNADYLKLAYNRKFDDPADPNKIFFRSDHFQYAKNMIPITFWFDGIHEDYHQPGDEPQKMDYAKMEKVARTIFLTMWQLTGLKERPKIDKDLPPQLKEQ